jgi:hypothetical protein
MKERSLKMAEFMLIPIPAEDYNALGITPNSILQTYVTPDTPPGTGGTLQIRAVTQGELEEFVCGGDCEGCPVAGTDCENDCNGCPCCDNCDDKERDKDESV